MKYILILVLVCFISCQEEPLIKEWNYQQTISLEGVNPIGIALNETGLWLSDGDHNRVVAVNNLGGVITEITDLDRPMHIAGQEKQLFIPQYGNDEVLRYENESRTAISPKDSLDAPAGISVWQAEIAIADFYNHMIHYSVDGLDWMTFGKEGNAEGEFYYPTDVQITAENIWVADAYNNRVQLFDKQGNFIKLIGVEQNINAATGIYVSESEVFVTDFENNRVLVFDLEGNLKQLIDQEVNKPTDLLIKDGQLLVANYKSSSLTVYEWAEKKKQEEDAHEEHEHEHDH